MSFHLNSNEEEIFTPNIDSLAYKGIILNRHYSNGGYESLVTGKYKRKAGQTNENLLVEYFARGGYRTKQLAKMDYESFDPFKEDLLNSVASARAPFLLIADFGAKKLDGKIVFKFPAIIQFCHTYMEQWLLELFDFNCDLFHGMD